MKSDASCKTSARRKRRPYTPLAIARCGARACSAAQNNIRRRAWFCKRPPGFTLIEVVVALVVTVLIWGATASALATVARMDAAAERLYEAALLARRLSERDERADEPETDSAPQGWRFERLTEKDADGRAWRGWRIQSPDSSIFDERIFTRPIRPSVPEAENKASDFSKCIRFAVHSCMKRMNTGIG